MKTLKDIFHLLFLLSLLVARMIFWTAIGSLPVIYFFIEADAIVTEVIITSIIVSFCYYKMMIWYKVKNNRCRI
jgi:hypothetical protein